MAKSCGVVCITNGEHFNSIKDAAKYAGVGSAWTMGVKMSVAGGFIDKEGREYRRENPMETKNQYRNTGKRLLKGRRKGIRKNIIKSEPPIIKPVKPQEDPLARGIANKTQEICEKAGCWEEVEALLKVLTIINKRN